MFYFSIIYVGRVRFHEDSKRSTERIVLILVLTEQKVMNKQSVSNLRIFSNFVVSRFLTKNGQNLA